MNTRLDFKGDYIGFTFNGVHSSELGIVRTSNGSRFDENLLPTIQDKTVQVPGGDGTYYFGSYYTQRQFSIPIAFDDLSEAQFERLRAHFGDKQIHELIFDERPYKIYRAKVTGTATIKYIPFDENKGRIYKGEGTIQFTCYSPYAICTQKYLNQYYNTNVDEWSAASGLLERQGNYDKLIDNTIQTYNPGVKPADWVLTISTQGSYGCLITLGEKDSENGIEIYWGSQPHDFPKQLILDSKSNLIKADDEIYNEYVDSGDFFQIPVGEGKITLVKLDKDKNPISDSSEWATISYNYYYL